MNLSGDNDLFSQLLSRSPDAFKQLYQEYKAPLFNLVYSFLHDRDRTADIIQDTFIQAMKNIRQLEEPHKIKHWLFRIAINLTINFLKRERRIDWAGDALEQILDREMSLNAPEGRDPGELFYLVSLEISSLPLKQQAPLIMKYMQNMKEAEIAEILDIPAGTVKSRLNAARAAIRAKISLLKITENEE